MRRLLALLSRVLQGDRRGIAVTEFGLIAPVFLLLIVGAFDISHTLLIKADLQGVVQKAARDASLEENGSVDAQAAIDAKVRAAVVAFDRSMSVPSITRRFYRTFSDAAARVPEPWNDTNNNGKCDANENYTDTNSNSVWDADGGDAGQGGPQDRVIYTVTVSYPRLLPLHKFIRTLSPNVTLEARTILANQPYNDQNTYATAVSRKCT